VALLGVPFFNGPLRAAVEAVRADAAIVATPVECLADVARDLMALGVSRLLVEKPAALSVGQGEALLRAQEHYGAQVKVAYNRRFYTSVRTARNMIAASGERVSSIFFEFTEWPHVIEALHAPGPSLARLALTNSTHVIDLAFSIDSLPVVERSLFVQHGALAWHSAGSIFHGAGTTATPTPFSYIANWKAPGRWGVEWMTTSTRYIFRPLESLHIVRNCRTEVEAVTRDNDDDVRFKPGFLRQAEEFLGFSEGGFSPSLRETVALLRVVSRMAGYSDMP
jgi:predicted dehydrogenase